MQPSRREMQQNKNVGELVVVLPLVSGMRISILGCGYVGLVTGACLAEIGHEVMCTDSDPGKIDVLEQGGLPIYEPGLGCIVDRNSRARRLSFTRNQGEAVRFGDVVLICVGTPPLRNGDADLAAMDEAAKLIVTEAHTSKLVVGKSTVPARTGQRLKQALAFYARRSTSQSSFRVASNPEFLREGTAVHDFLHPERIVIGVEDETAGDQLCEIYLPIVEQRFSCPIHTPSCPQKPAPIFLVTDINSAEVIKHACNTFLALKISYANLIADFCEKTNADVDQVMEAMGLDPRIGPAFLRPGLGFGGFCLPKDIQAFIRLGERVGVDVSLLNAVESINQCRVESFMQKLHQALWVIKHKEIAVLGLAFKPETDDVRLAPALKLIRQILDAGGRVRAYDPQAMKKASAELPDVTYCESAYEAAQGAEALVIATEWEQFRQLNWELIRTAMNRPLILDGRNFLPADRMRSLGFEYCGVGKRVENPVNEFVS
jgi:UDPglucose 6-dehydrogenase